MFQFPANPAVGQIFNAAPGVQYSWNGTGWAPYSTTFLGSLTLTGPLLLPDGTGGAPALAFANEPGTGIYRSAPHAINIAMNGVTTFGLTDLLFNITVPSIFNQSVTGANFVARSGGLAPFIANSNQVHNNGLLTVGDATNMATVQHYTRNVGGGQTEIYRYAPNGATLTGAHYLRGMNAGAVLRVTGAAYNTGSAGVTLASNYGDAVTVAGIDMPLIDGTPGSEKGEMRLSIIRNGQLRTDGDVVLQRNNTNTAQMLVRGGWNNDLTNVTNVPLCQVGNAGISLQPGIGQLDGQGYGIVWVNAANVHYWGSAGGGGPISGWAMTLNAAGQASALNFTQLSDAGQKKNVSTMSHALADLLKLRGVRYVQASNDAPSMGLIAQEVAAVYPELVGEISAPPTTPDVVPAKFKTLNYMGLTAPLIEAMRELDARVKILEATV